MKRITAVAAWFACAALLLAPNRAAAQASSEASPEAQQKTILTFSSPVRVPGATLPAGEYIFRLASPASDQQTVEILQKDGTPVARVMTVPLSVPGGANSQVLMFDAAGGQPPALRAWFYPGAGAGHEFVYSRDEARDIARHANIDVLAADLSAPAGSAATIVRMTSQGQEQAYSKSAGQTASSQSSSPAAMLPYSSSDSSSGARQPSGASGTAGSAGTTGSVGTTGTAGTSGAVGTTGATSATGATIEHSGATSAAQPATSGESPSPRQSAATGQSSSVSSGSSSAGEKNEHLNQAREEQRREAAKYLDRAESLLRGGPAQSAAVSGAQLQQLHNEVQALQRAFEPTRSGSAIKNPDIRNWEEQYTLVMKDLSKYSSSIGTSGRAASPSSSEIGSESRSSASSSNDDTLQQVRADLLRFHDIATDPKWTPPKKK